MHARTPIHMAKETYSYGKRGLSRQAYLTLEMYAHAHIHRNTHTHAHTHTRTPHNLHTHTQFTRTHTGEAEGGVYRTFRKEGKPLALGAGCSAQVLVGLFCLIVGLFCLKSFAL